MANLRHTLEDFLQDARVLIGNSQTVPEVSGALKDFGYTPERLAEGQALLQAAESLVLQPRKEYGDQYDATSATQKAWDAADSAYIKTLKIARLVFVDDVQAITALRLAGSRKATLAGWTEQAVVFYGNLLAQPPLVSALARFGYSPAKLTAEKALVDAVVTLAQKQAKETGEAQKATAARDAALNRLDTWVGELRTVVKVALADDPQTLEAVGTSVSVGGRPKKKVAVKA